MPDQRKRNSAVRKPVGSLQRTNPREFQLGQVVRRFSPTRQDTDKGTLLSFTLQPSDPDFPFELEQLQCTLSVPTSYPSHGRPTIRITNAEMARGYQINVERGFDSLAAESQKTLLALLNELDRNLERFLSTEKAQTIKIVPNAQRRTPQPTWGPHPAPPVEAPDGVSTAPSRPSYTPQQRSDATVKRQTDIRQLEARMGRLPHFSKSADGMSFNVPVQMAKAGPLPPNLQPLKEITLIVPALYNLEPCTIKLKGVSGSEVDNVEVAFERQVRQNPALTLMAHINHLTQNISSMALEAPEKIGIVSLGRPPKPASDAKVQISATEDDISPRGPEFDEHPHVKVIPRPPEWDRARADANDDDSTESDHTDQEGTDEEEEEDEDGTGGAPIPVAHPVSTAQKGILLSFPQLELHGIELLEIVALSLTIRCDRCKQTVDVKNIKPSPTEGGSSTRTESCTKCANDLGVSYHAEPMHINSIKAGSLDLDGGAVTDMLPSAFVPTCSECSTSYPKPGVISVRGETTLTVCRECHKKMTFKIPEIKFLRVSTNSTGDARLRHGATLLPRPRRKEVLGITAGTELPDRGRCKHYSKSYRWFRFSCCNRVFACDKCHDESEAHPNEHANRMICGWCSREQNYRPDDCGLCGRNLVGKRGGGFWEGGKGTRDKTKMNRKDPRKYKRRGATGATGS